MKKLNHQLKNLFVVLLVAIILFCLFFIIKNFIKEMRQESNNNVENNNIVKVDNYNNKENVNKENISYIESQLPGNFKADYASFRNYKMQAVRVVNYSGEKHYISDGEIDCNVSSRELSSSEQTYKNEINDRKYCISSFSEGAAGSVYTTYTYTTVVEDMVYQISFVVRYSNCGNWPEERRIECQTERENFNLDSLVDEVVSYKLENNNNVYKNDKYGFKFLKPHELIVEEGDNYISLISFENKKLMIKNSVNCSDNNYDTECNPTLNLNLLDIEILDEINLNQIEKIGSVKFNDIYWEKYEAIGSLFERIKYVNKYNDKYYIVNTHNTEEEIKEILKTFEFIN